MQKNLPSYTPEWVETLPLWAEASKRTVTYALCNDRRTLLWFANQRAVEYHPTLGLADRLDRATHLVLDLDPPEGDGFAAAVARRPPRAPGTLRRRPRRRGQDERRQGRPRLRPDRATAGHGGRRGGDAGDRPARRAARPGDRHDGVHQGRSRRQGVRRRHAHRRGDGRRRLQPAGAPGRPGVVPRLVGRARRRRHRPTSRSARRPTCSAAGDPWAERDARPAACPRRPRRRGPRDPRRPRRRDARGQAPQAGGQALRADDPPVPWNARATG